MKAFRPFVSAMFALAAAVLIFPAGAVEREAAQEEEEAPQVQRQNSKVGFEAESKLKVDPAGKSYFFLTNEPQWPEKKELQAPAPSRPAEPKKEIVKKPEPPETAEEKVQVSDTSEKIKHTAAAPAAKKAETPAKKSKPKKPAVNLPDIDQLLEDVKRSAQPKLANLENENRPAEILSAPEAAPERNFAEVEESVDMEELARDLEKLRVESSATGPKKNESVKESDPERAEWILAAAVTLGAASVVGAMIYVRRKRQQPIRSQTHIDSETRVILDRLLAEQRRRASIPKTAVRPAPAREEEFHGTTTAVMAAPPADESADESAAEPDAPHVYLLPPELSEGAYRDVIQFAAEGLEAAEIAERLNMGEGEVRLVLDIARLSQGA